MRGLCPRCAPWPGCSRGTCHGKPPNDQGIALTHGLLGRGSRRPGGRHCHSSTRKRYPYPAPWRPRQAGSPGLGSAPLTTALVSGGQLGRVVRLPGGGQGQTWAGGDAARLRGSQLLHTQLAWRTVLLRQLEKLPGARCFLDSLPLPSQRRPQPVAPLRGLLSSLIAGWALSPGHPGFHPSAPPGL